MFTGVKLRIIEWFCNQTFRYRSLNTFRTAKRSNHLCKRLSYRQSFKSPTILFVNRLYYSLLLSPPLRQRN